MSYEFIRYRPEFKSDVGELLTEFWPDPATGVAQFTWTHEQNPYTGHPLFYLLLSEGKVVAMRGFYGARWEIAGSGETFEAPCATMFVTDESFRGKGLANIVMKGALDDLRALGYQYVFSTGARPIPYMSQLRRGWRLAGAYRTLTRSEKTDAKKARQAVGDRFPLLRTVWRSVRRKIPRPETDEFSSLDTSAPAELDGGALSVSREADSAMMAELARDVAIPGLIRHVRDETYFAWRFKSPRMEHRFVSWRDAQDRGFLVLQKPRGKARSMSIIDWEATTTEVLMRMIGVAIEYGQFDELSIWHSALSDEIAALLFDNGFAPIDETMGYPDYHPGLIVKSLDDNPPEGAWEISGRRIDDFAAWDVREAYFF